MVNSLGGPRVRRDTSRSHITLKAEIIHPILAISPRFPAFASLRFPCEWKKRMAATTEIETQIARISADGFSALIRAICVSIRAYVTS
jgi:hypothetical protein